MLVFAEDPSFWHEPFTTTRLAHATGSGAFRMEGLRAGCYLVVAIDRDEASIREALGVAIWQRPEQHAVARLMIAVLAPMPSANVSTTAVLTPGARLMNRAAWHSSRRTTSVISGILHGKRWRRCRPAGASGFTFAAVPSRSFFTRA